MQFELALVDTETGAKRVLRTLTVDPRGFSLSADGRFVAFDMPRQEPGGTLDIIIHEISTSREWPLVDKAGDRSLPVWSPGGDQLFYVESLNDTTALQAVRVSGVRARITPTRSWKAKRHRIRGPRDIRVLAGDRQE
jgi:Tol biopolymer transport system component